MIFSTRAMRNLGAEKRRGSARCQDTKPSLLQCARERPQNSSTNNSQTLARSPERVLLWQEDEAEGSEEVEALAVANLGVVLAESPQHAPQLADAAGRRAVEELVEGECAQQIELNLRGHALLAKVAQPNIVVLILHSETKVKK